MATSMGHLSQNVPGFVVPFSNNVIMIKGKRFDQVTKTNMSAEQLNWSDVYVCDQVTMNKISAEQLNWSDVCACDQVTRNNMSAELSTWICYGLFCDPHWLWFLIYCSIHVLRCSSMEQFTLLSLVGDFLREANIHVSLLCYTLLKVPSILPNRNALPRNITKILVIVVYLQM